MPSLRVLPVVLFHPDPGRPRDQPPAQTGRETPPWREPYAQLHQKLVNAAHVQLFVPEVHDHHWGKLAQPFFAPEVKQPFLELPDLFLEHLACSKNTEDERSCQGWPKDTAKRHWPLLRRVRRTLLISEGMAKGLPFWHFVSDDLEAVSQPHPSVCFTSPLICRTCCVPPQHLRERQPARRIRSCSAPPAANHSCANW